MYFTEIPPKYLLLVINWILLSHLYFDLKMRRILELDLLKRILAIGSNPTTTNPVKAGGEDSGNLWPLLHRIFSRNLSFSLISIILIIILSIIFFVNLKKMHQMQLIFAAFAIPFFGTYFHYYDSVALVILGIYILVNSSNLSIIFVVFALDFLLIAHQFTKITNILFVLIISTVMMKIKETVLDRKIIVRFLLGHVIYFTISILNIHLFQPGHLFNSLITTETFIVLLFLHYKKFKKILQ